MKLSRTGQLVGQAKLRSDDWSSLLTAVTKMKTNGMTKKTSATASAAISTTSRRAAPHRSTSFEFIQRNSGKTISGDQDEEHDVAGGRQAEEARLVLLVDDRGDDVAAEAGATAGHRPDQVEGPQAADERQQDDAERRRPAERQGDVPELVPGTAAVHVDGLVVVLGDRQDAGDVDHRRQPDALPDVDEGDRQQRGGRSIRASPGPPSPTHAGRCRRRRCRVRAGRRR